MQLVAITQRTEFVTHHNETRDALDQRWHDFFHACQMTSLLIPNHPTIAQNLISNLSVRGIILSGGNDSTARDDTETKLIDLAIEKKIPILGICHGMQVIQRRYNIPLHALSGHVSDKQEILIHNEPSYINSYHILGTCESHNDLIVWARAYDNTVKAICHQTLPIVGIMWHPERYDAFRDDDIDLVSKLFNVKNNDSFLSTLRKEVQHLTL